MTYQHTTVKLTFIGLGAIENKVTLCDLTPLSLSTCGVCSKSNTSFGKQNHFRAAKSNQTSTCSIFFLGYDLLSTSSNIGDYNRPYYRYIQLWRSPCSSFSTSDETYQLLNAPPRKLAHLVIALHIESSIRISKSNALSFFLKSNSVKSLYLDFS